MEIHPTAVVSPTAELAEDVQIKAFSVIGPRVVIGLGSVVGPHAVIDGWTTLGERNQIFPFAVIGYPPQDMSYRGEETQLLIGNDNVIRESVTINRGTQRGGGVTRVGNHNLFMAYAHVAHDCIIGNHVILANATTLGGHVHIDDFAIL
jgi:UDP-N-acetylglucosamine acyltransferase